MLDKLNAIYQRYVEITNEMNDPDVMKDMKRYIKLNKDYKELTPVVEAFRAYQSVLKGLEDARDILSNEKDEELKEMAKEELSILTEKKDKMEEDIRVMLIPSDPQDGKNAIVEIRAGTGGDEASIFAGDLYRMYTRFCENKGWKIDVVDYTEGTVGGYKEVIFDVSGENVYGQLKYESGVHRVQRVPKTETQGRIHTSAASVVVNTTYSAVRLTHIPTGVVATCQDQKSQLKNYEKAMAVLRSRIYEMEYQKYLDDVSHKRKTMVSTGDRSAKVRTYNWPQSRVTDHRINLTLYNLQTIIDGDVQPLIDALQLAENAERLKEAVG